MDQEDLSVWDAGGQQIKPGDIVFLKPASDCRQNNIENDLRHLLNRSDAELNLIKIKYKSTHKLEDVHLGVRALRVIDFVRCQCTHKGTNMIFVFVICQLVSEDDLKQERVLNPEDIELMTKNDANDLNQFNTTRATLPGKPWNPIQILLRDHAPYIPGTDNMELIAIHQSALMTMRASHLKCTMEQYLEQSREQIYAFSKQVEHCDHCQNQSLFSMLDEKERQDYYKQDEVNSMEVEPPVNESVYLLECPDGQVQFRVRNAYEFLPKLPQNRV